MTAKTKESLNVCGDLFDDYAVKEFIKSNKESDFCDWTKKNKPSISLETLSNFLEECILCEYDDPYSLGAGYDKEEEFYEDRFPGIDVEQTIELLESHFSETPFEILEMIQQLFSNNYWAGKHLYSPSNHEILTDSWSDFREIIKHKVRFMFFDSKMPKFDLMHEEYSNPYEILNETGNAIIKLNLISTLKKGDLKIYRARQHIQVQKVQTIHDIGPPVTSPFLGQLVIMQSQI